MVAFPAIQLEHIRARRAFVWLCDYLIGFSEGLSAIILDDPIFRRLHVADSVLGVSSICNVSLATLDEQTHSQ